MVLSYTEVEGKHRSPVLTLYTLSYCHSCSAARELLESFEFAYRYLVVDKLPKQQILQVKRQIIKPGERSILYPVLQIDDQFFYGYNPGLWKHKLEGAAVGSAR